MFQHKNIHRATWVSADHITANQIDHICIGRKFRHSLLDVRVRRGADAGSDHHLLTATIKLKLKALKHRERRVNLTYSNYEMYCRYNRTLYKVTLHNRYHV